MAPYFLLLLILSQTRHLGAIEQISFNELPLTILSHT